MLRRLAIVALLVITLVAVQLWVMSYRKLPVVHLASEPHVVLAAFEGRLGVIWSDRPIWPAADSDTTIQLREPPCQCSVPLSLFASTPGTMATTASHRIVPVWLIALPSTALLTGLLIAPFVRAERRRRRGCCEACGYALAGLPAGHRCPECGIETSAAVPPTDPSHTPPPPAKPLPQRRTRRLAIAAAISFYLFAGVNTAWLMLAPNYEACPEDHLNPRIITLTPQQQLDRIIEQLRKQHPGASIDIKLPLRMDPMFELHEIQLRRGKRMPADIVESGFLPSG